MPKLPILSAKEVIKVLRKYEFEIVRQSGSHIHLWNEKRKLLVTVPNHSELAKGTLLAIIKQAKLTKEEFIQRLR